MKKICRKIKLRKYKTEFEEMGIDSIVMQEGREFAVIYDDGKAETHLDTWDLRRALERDHIRKIYYIFDMTDKISIDRSVVIDTENI